MNAALGCADKLTYTRRGARLVLRYTEQSGLTMYYCRVCHWWHIGNRAPGTRQKPESPPKPTRNDYRRALDDDDD